MVISVAAAKKDRVLVVDDEPSVRDLVHELLDDAGYEVTSVRDGKEAVRTFFQWRPALVVLDIAMPGMDGWNVLERIREVSSAPVIMLTALGRENDAVRGLRNGADDYIVKPARTAELVARVESLLRRSRTQDEESDATELYSDAVLRVDHARHEVAVDGTPVDLTPQEFRLLAVLVQNAGLVMSADRLGELCWPGGGGVENVRVYVGHLRKKLGDDPRTPRMIETLREFGYRYCPAL
jgi:DNA-binding response OmpR family regulator